MTHFHSCGNPPVTLFGSREYEFESQLSHALICSSFLELLVQQLMRSPRKLELTRSQTVASTRAFITWLWMTFDLTPILVLAI